MTCLNASMSRAAWATLRVCQTTLLAKFMYVPRCVLETLQGVCDLEQSLVIVSTEDMRFSAQILKRIRR